LEVPDIVFTDESQQIGEGRWQRRAIKQIQAHELAPRLVNRQRFILASIEHTRWIIVFRRSFTTNELVSQVFHAIEILLPFLMPTKRQ
jgi:hypothetical protein